MAPAGSVLCYLTEALQKARELNEYADVIEQIWVAEGIIIPHGYLRR